MKVSKKLNADIIKYCQENEIKLDFDYRDTIEKEDLKKILESENGLLDFESEIYDLNIDYIAENERYFLENEVFEQFQDRFSKKYSDEEIKEFLVDNYVHYTICYMNIEQLINNIGEITCLIPFYSNYDCCNSFDDPKEKDTYLYEVYQRVKQGIKRKDFEYEFFNGAYGGSLFCLAFQTDIFNLLDLKKELKEKNYVNIPQGTQIGFFSSWSGSGSPFDKTTYRNMKIKVKEIGNGFYPEYDRIDIIADIEQHYSMLDVYGENDFILSQNIVLTN